MANVTHTSRNGARTSRAALVAIAIAAGLGACGTAAGEGAQQTPAPPINAAAQQAQSAEAPAVADATITP